MLTNASAASAVKFKFMKEKKVKKEMRKDVKRPTTSIINNKQIPTSKIVKLIQITISCYLSHYFSIKYVVQTFALTASKFCYSKNK